MIRRTLALATTALVLALVSPAASAANPSTAPPVAAFGIDCTEAPTPDTPGQGLMGFFSNDPEEPPPAEDPFAPGSRTTIYEQYGYAGLRWHTYDLGCGPDATRSPDAVVGTAVSNWIMNVPVLLASATSSIVDVAFAPQFLDVFDPLIERTSRTLHEKLFASWVPVTLAVLGLLLLLKARRAQLATTAAAVGWAAFVLVVATALFRWPVAAGHFADETVSASLASVVNGFNGDADTSAGVAVASSVQDQLLYQTWLAGELGTTDSATAKKYGPQLFKAQTLSWREAHTLENDPEQGREIIESKKEMFEDVAAEIKDGDPVAYEHLTGKRSDTRMGYALLSTLAMLLVLPFLLVSALLLLGSFLIVRLAVMLFPAFATLGVLPAGRGLVVGIGRTVAAALVNAVVFGVGAVVTIRLTGLLLDPATGLPTWLSLVLLSLFAFIMWVALKPFRRLTHMVDTSADPFGDAAGSLGSASARVRGWAGKAATLTAASYTGNVAAALAVADVDPASAPAGDSPERVEARPVVQGPVEDSGSTAAPSKRSALPTAPTAAEPPPSPSPASSQPRSETPTDDPDQPTPVPPAESVPLPPTEPEWVEGEEVYNIYRPAELAGDPA